MKRIISTVIALLLLLLFTACGGNSVVGKWYNSKGKCLDVRSDGTWKLEDSYGTGTWKKLDDGRFEFIDFYGDTQESAINKNDNGEYIDFGMYGDFYKTKPKSDDELSITPTNTSKIKEDTEIGSEFKSIDPFDGISYFVSGISPYCQISVNNQNCSAEAQKYVTYKFDKERYSNGETAIITADFSNRTYESEYILTSVEHTFKIENQPEYITSLDGIDLSMLENELNDYVTAQTSAAINSWGLWGLHAAGNSYSTYSSIDEISNNETYFLSLKPIKQSNNIEFYNSLNFIYSFKAKMSGGSINGEEKCNVYANISAYNIVKYPDGTIRWGTEDPDSYDFAYSAGTNGVNELVTTTITALSSDYNITKVSP